MLAYWINGRVDKWLQIKWKENWIGHCIVCNMNPINKLT